MAHYVLFLLDLANEKTRIGKVAFEPSRDLTTTNAFVWRVVHDAEGKVVVWSARERGTEIIATARWRDAALHDARQKTAAVPTAYQWSLVEDAVRTVVAQAIAEFGPAVDERGDASSADPFRRAPDDVREDVARLEAGFLARDDWREELVAPESVPDTAANQRARADWARGAAKADARWRERRTRKRIALAGAVILVVAAAVLGVFAASGSKRRPASALAPLPTRTTPPPAAPPEPSLDERIANAGTVDAAVVLATPLRDGEPSIGNYAFAKFAAAKLRWPDVATPDTTIGRVEKDPDPERGKRLCASGAIERIERRNLDARKVYAGSLTTPEGDRVAFLAVGSTGDLVKRSSAKLCGIVTGKAGDAVAVIGMFELPENEHPVVEQ